MKMERLPLGINPGDMKAYYNANIALMQNIRKTAHRNSSI
jgi:hypothetical protein